MSQKPVKELTDEQLFAELREQVNRSRFDGRHDRLRTRQLSAELRKREQIDTKNKEAK